MKTNLFLSMIIICQSLFTSQCNSQSNKNSGTDDRQPAVAGQFYSANPEELHRDLDDIFTKAVPSLNKDKILALIVPHAGYVFSGQVAASAFNQLDRNKKYKRIFIIGSSHVANFEGASIYAKGHFITPLGKVPVDTTVASELLNSSSIFSFNKNVHASEHSLEVEIPFLQYIYGNNFCIVPITIGTSRIEDCKAMADALKSYLTPENLFIISTDFSHYPLYKDAVEIDKLTEKAILKNSAEELLNTLNRNDSKKTEGLVTSLCGWTSVLTFLYMTGNNDSYRFTHLLYQNSGDSQYGDSSRVVGYNSIMVTLDQAVSEAEFELCQKDKEELLKIARNTIVSYINDKKYPQIDTSGFSQNIKKHCGAFVTLHKGGNLRGCIGRFSADIPLYQVVSEMAVASSTQDYRFSPLVKSEIPEIDIEISVLSPMKKISSIDEIELGKHGIYIIKGNRNGTFLPQVANETGWSKEEFLGHCAQDKAGIGWTGWKDKDTEIYIYTAIVFGEE